MHLSIAAAVATTGRFPQPALLAVLFEVFLLARTLRSGAAASIRAACPAVLGLNVCLNAAARWGTCAC